MFALPNTAFDTCVHVHCGKPLGQESKDLGYMFCHEHRICPICEIEIPLPELKQCYKEWQESMDAEGNLETLDLKHSRCKVIGHLSKFQEDPTISIKQSHYDLLNNIRLMVDPDLNLSQTTNENNAMIHVERFIHEMDWDQRYLTLKKLEACVAIVSMSVVNDKEKKKQKADLVEKERGKKAKLEALTSTRPAAKVNEPNNEFEVSLGQFMENFGIKSRKMALTLQKNRDKAVEALVKLKIPSKMAKDAADKELLENISKGKVKIEE